jgi:hypothetical protein
LIYAIITSLFENFKYFAFHVLKYGSFGLSV